MKPKQPKLKAAVPRAASTGRDLAKIPFIANTNAYKPDITMVRLDHESGFDFGNCGKLVTFSDITVKNLEACKFFDRHHGFQFFHYPATLLRRQTVELAEDFLIQRRGGGSGQRRTLLVGGPGSGRSVILAQLLAVGWHTNHVVVFLPRGMCEVLQNAGLIISTANDLMNNTTSYEFNEKQKRYALPQYASWLCATIEETNRNILEKVSNSIIYSCATDFCIAPIE